MPRGRPFGSGLPRDTPSRDPAVLDHVEPAPGLGRSPPWGSRSIEPAVAQRFFLAFLPAFLPLFLATFFEPAVFLAAFLEAFLEAAFLATFLLAFLAAF